MAYYYSRNKGNHKINKPYNHNKNQNTNLDPYPKHNRNNKELDTLIIDENTVYEIDEECIEKHLKSRKSNKNI